MNHILQIHASMRVDGSQSRALSEALVGRLKAQGPVEVKVRDLAEPIPFVDDAWIAANLTEAAARTDDQKSALAMSDQLVNELQWADTLVIGLPIYNFGPPAALKAWIDMVARARVTFRYGENGPEGLLTGKKAFLIVASGGTAIDSNIDFATPYMRHVLGFVGIHDVTVVAADRLMIEGMGKIDQAKEQIEVLTTNKQAA